MASSDSANDTARNTILDRLVGAVPTQYREEVTRVANRIWDRFPPVMLEHRLDALERHVDERLAAIDATLERILKKLDAR